MAVIEVTPAEFEMIGVMLRKAGEIRTMARMDGLSLAEKLALLRAEKSLRERASKIGKVET